MGERTVEYSIRIRDDGSEAARNIQSQVVELGGSLEQTSERSEELNKRLVNLSQASSLLQNVNQAISQLAGVFDEMTGAYAKQVEAETKLEQVMRNTMQASDAEIQSIKDLASAQQELGVVGDEVVLAGAQELATYMDKKESLEKLIPVMNDIVAQQYGYNATAEGAVSIATMMGKVFEGQVSALSRYGYSFSDAEEKILKFGNEEEKAATLAEVVSRSVGGVNAALAKTDTGRMVQLKNRMGDLKESIGRVIIPLSGFVKGLAAAGTTTTGMMQLGTAVKGATVAVKAMLPAQLKLNAATLANPYVAAAAALGVAIYKLSTRASEAERMQKKLNDAVSDAQVRMGTEKRQADELFGALGKAERGSDAYREALKKINEVYGEYLPNQLTEASNANEIAAAYDRATQALTNKIMLEMRDAAMTETAGEALKNRLKTVNSYRKELESRGASAGDSANVAEWIVTQAEAYRKAGTNYYEALKKINEGVRQSTNGMSISEADRVKELVTSVYELENAYTQANNAFAPLLKNMKTLGHSGSALSGEIKRDLGDGEKASKGAKSGEKGAKGAKVWDAETLGWYADRIKSLREEQQGADEAHATELERQINLLEKELKIKHAYITAGAAELKPMETGIKPLEIAPVKTDIKKAERELGELDERLKKAYWNKKGFAKEFVTGLDAMSGAFNDLGRALDGSAGRWLSFAGSVTSAVGASELRPYNGAIMVGASEPRPYNGAIMGGGASEPRPYNGAMLAIPKFAKGGIAYGPTLGMFGEYAGASTNPEVVAPLSRLRDLIEPDGEGAGRVVFRISGRDLEGVLEKRARYNSRT